MFNPEKQKDPDLLRPEPGLGFRVERVEFRVESLEFRVQGLGFRIQGSGFRIT